MSTLSIALCGNETVEAILREKLTQYYPAEEWQLTSRSIPLPPKPSEPELYASPMLERTKQHASLVHATTQGANLGIAFEYGVIRTAVVVNLAGLDLLEMSLEEIGSSEVRQKIQTAQKEAERDSPRFAQVSVASVVNAQGDVFGCMTVDLGESTKVIFHWGEGSVTHEPEYVDVGNIIPNHGAFVRAVGGALLEYHAILCDAPSSKN